MSAPTNIFPNTQPFGVVWSRFPRVGSYWTLERTYPLSYITSSGGYALRANPGEPIQFGARLFAWFHEGVDPNNPESAGLLAGDKS